MVDKHTKFWFSEKHSEHLRDMRECMSKDDRPSFCEIFVDGEWKEYTECTTGVNSRPHFEDAILLHEGMWSNRPELRINGVVQSRVL